MLAGAAAATAAATRLYAQRAQLLAANKKTSEIAKFAGWHDVADIPGTQLRVFFTPEPGKQRKYLDTVTEVAAPAQPGAKRSRPNRRSKRGRSRTR